MSKFARNLPSLGISSPGAAKIQVEFQGGIRGGGEWGLAWAALFCAARFDWESSRFAVRPSAALSPMSSRSMSWAAVDALEEEGPAAGPPWSDAGGMPDDIILVVAR